jgi:hypothetical protein
VIEGTDLRQYLDGDKPIPTRDELQLEARQKRQEEQDGHKDEMPTGPDIIMARPEGSSAQTQEIPVRPDV